MLRQEIIVKLSGSHTEQHSKMKVLVGERRVPAGGRRWQMAGRRITKIQNINVFTVHTIRSFKKPDPYVIYVIMS